MTTPSENRAEQLLREMAMAEPDLKRVKEVFTEALEKPPDQRQAYVEEACRGDRRRSQRRSDPKTRQTRR